MNENRKPLVDAPGLLAILFAPKCRPSVAWVRRKTKDRSIPCIPVGRLVFYDPDAVRESLAARHTIRARGNGHLAAA
jgi:hypothetical protein